MFSAGLRASFSQDDSWQQVTVSLEIKRNGAVIWTGSYRVNGGKSNGGNIGVSALYRDTFTGAATYSLWASRNGSGSTYIEDITLVAIGCKR